ncbi:hypothetical protein Tco_1345167 [Tanacetum coccineum]
MNEPISYGLPLKLVIPPDTLTVVEYAFALLCSGSGKFIWGKGSIWFRLSSISVSIPFIIALKCSYEIVQNVLIRDSDMADRVNTRLFLVSDLPSSLRRGEPDPEGLTDLLLFLTTLLGFCLMGLRSSYQSSSSITICFPLVWSLTLSATSLSMASSSVIKASIRACEGLNGVISGRDVVIVVASVLLVVGGSGVVESDSSLALDFS